MQKLMDKDILAGLVFFIIGAIAWSKAGNDVMNWAFPLMAAYFVLFAAAFLILRVVLGVIAERAPDIIRVSAEDRVVWRDVSSFLLIALCYLLVLYSLGFWLASFLMLSLTSIYLTQDRTRQNMALAVGVPLAVCVAANLVFEHVFYVPVPEASWWPLAG